MATSRIEHKYIRPVFRDVIEQWGDVSVSVEDSNVVNIRRTLTAMLSEHIALLIVGENRLDPHLFERCAAYRIGRLLEDGWSIRLLDLDFTPNASTAELQQNSAPGMVIAKVLAETERLRYVLFLTHSRHAINLSASGNDLVVDQRVNGSTSLHGMSIAQLCLSKAASKDGWIDVFGCFCQPNAQWAKALAKALNWPVRTVYPGYGIYFPDGDPYPKSAIPLTRHFSPSRYCQYGWAVWLPGSDRPVRVSEPGETARRHDTRYGFWERLLIAVLSVGLEPVRDFRKLRLLPAVRRP